MRSRLSFENELMAKLEAQGYSCLRSAGSRGAADILAVSWDCARMIQVKSTIALDRKGNVSVFKKAIKDLFKMPCPPFVTRELWVRVLRKGWIYISLDDAPQDDRELTEYIKTVEWIKA